VNSQLTWFDASGRTLGTLGDPIDQFSFEISPDGRRVLASALDAQTMTRDLWVYDIERSLRRRLTFGTGDEVLGVWSPDGQRILFNSQRAGRRLDLFERAADGSGQPALVLESTEYDKMPTGYSPDSRILVFGTLSRGIGPRAFLFWPADKRQRPFRMSSVGEGMLRISPNGRWVAFRTNETGQTEIAVASFPDPGTTVQVSNGFGSWPRWRADGKEVFWVTENDFLMATEVDTTGPTVRVGRERKLFQLQARTAPYGGVINAANGITAAPYDVSANGERILVNVQTVQQGVSALTLVQDWRRLLRGQ
jgi:Tol biopolymer transport system component